MSSKQRESLAGLRSPSIQDLHIRTTALITAMYNKRWTVRMFESLIHFLIRPEIIITAQDALLH